MVGASLVRQLEKENCTVLTAGPRQGARFAATQASVGSWMNANNPDAVLLAAAKVGGIVANDTYPAEFLFDNLAIESAIIHASHQAGRRKAPVPGLLLHISRSSRPSRSSRKRLLTGPLEPTNEWYALAKIAGIKLCQAYRKQYGHDFISAMPTNLYGPGDNFNLQASHVIPAMMRKAP